MKTAELVEIIDNLPDDKKKEFEDIVSAFISNTQKNNTSAKPKMKFGELKGFVTYIADDFDAPLDDFKEYM